MTIDLPPQDAETPRPDIQDVLHVWFQPQQIGRCKGCRQTVEWRRTVRNNAWIAFEFEHEGDPRGPRWIRRFSKVGADMRREGDRVDILNRAYVHIARCPQRDRFRSRHVRPIELSKPAARERSLFDKE